MSSRQPDQNEAEDQQWYEDPDLVPIKTRQRPPPGELILHHSGSDTIYRKLEDLEAEWAGISKKILQIVGSAPEAAIASLDSVTFSLGFNAKGKIAFLAEAGAEASISVTFKPRRNDGEKE